MEDLKQIQEFFSKPLEENIVVRMYNTTDKTADLYKEDNPGLEFYLTGKEGQDYVRKYKDHISFPFSSHMNDGTPIPNYEENKEKLSAYLKQKGIPFKTTSAKPNRGVSRTTGEDFMYTTDTFKVPLSHVDIKDISLEENITDWPKEVSSRYNEYKFVLDKVMSDRAKYKVIDIETGKEEIGGRVYGTPSQLQAAADDLIKPQGGRQSSHFGVNEGNENIGVEDFDRVVQAISQTNHPVTVLLTPIFGKNEIEIIVGNDAPDPIVDAMFNIIADLGYKRGEYSIVGDTSSLSRREYSQIRRINGGHKEYQRWEESVDEAKIEVDDKTEFKLDLKHLLDKHVVEQGYSLTKEHETDPNMELKVGDYQTQHFHMCPGAKSLYQDIEDKVEDMGLAIRSAKLQDALFAMEESALENGANEADVFAAETIADQIMAMAAMMGLDKEHSYIQGHVDKIKGAVDKGQVAEASYVRVSEPKFVKDKTNPNFLYVNFKYDTGGGVLTALGKETMAGQIRRLSSAEAMKQATALAKDLEAKYNLEDIDVYDKENGVVQIFAVSDDFIDMDPNMLNEASKEEYEALLDKEHELTSAYMKNKTDANWEKLSDVRKKGKKLEKELEDQGLLEASKGALNYFNDLKYYYQKAFRYLDVEEREEYKQLAKDFFSNLQIDDKVRAVGLEEKAAYIAETIKLGLMLNEELCDKGKRYIKARQAAGEKSSAYLSGRAVRVCKGQIEWPKKGKNKK